MSDFANLPWNLRRSLTVDNGTKHAQHQAVTQALYLPIYFCHSYTTYERGTIKNTIGLMQQYSPKKTLFAYLTQHKLTIIARLLNHRPRKYLGFRTPSETLAQELGRAFSI